MRPWYYIDGCSLKNWPKQFQYHIVCEIPQVVEYFVTHSCKLFNCKMISDDKQGSSSDNVILV